MTESARSGDLLHAIVAAARRSSVERERALPMGALENLARTTSPRGDAFRASLKAPGARIIAECKRRSPSRGVLRHDYDPAAIAAGYEKAGAAAISVLTEPAFFDGSIAHLRSVRAAVSIPVLRKDFIVTDYQIVETRAAGADGVLLIVAALTSQELRRLIAAALSIGLMPLVEVHTADELEAALGAGATVIGINSRNLRTLDVDTSVFEKLVLGVPAEVVAVAESGLKTADDVRRLRADGFDAFLIGERFMTEPSPGHSLEEFRNAAEAVMEELR